MKGSVPEVDCVVSVEDSKGLKLFLDSHGVHCASVFLLLVE